MSDKKAGAGARRRVELEIEQATVRYYAQLRGGAAVEAEAIARASSRAAADVNFDDAAPETT